MNSSTQQQEDQDKATLFQIVLLLLIALQTDSDRELVEGEDYEVERNPDFVSETDTEDQGQSDGEEPPSKQKRMGDMEADSTDVHGGFGAGNVEEPQNSKFSGKWGKQNFKSAVNKVVVKRRFNKPTKFGIDFDPSTAMATIDISGERNHDSNVLTSKLEFNHGGVIIPYFYREASMDVCDWALEQGAVGYRIKSFGFTINHFHCISRPNDKGDTAQVPPQIPDKIHLWMLVDEGHHYGVSQFYDPQSTDFSHCDQFQDRKGVSSSNSRVMKQQPNRQMWLPKSHVKKIIHHGWSYSDNKYTHDDPNKLIDITALKGYRDIVLSDMTDLSYNYEVPNPKWNFFNIDAHYRMDYSGKIVIDAYDNTYGMHGILNNNESKLSMWPTATFNVETVNNMTKYQRNRMNDKVFGSRAPSMSQTDMNELQGTARVFRNNESAVVRAEGPPMKTSTAFLNPKFGYKTRMDALRNPLTGEGRGSDETTPPIVLLGVYPDVERTETGYKFYKYWAHGEIEYFSEEEFMYISGAPAHIRYGPNGNFSTYKSTGQPRVKPHVHKIPEVATVAIPT